MRILMLTGLLAAAAGLPLSAQRGHQFELGAFGSFTRYDRAFNLSDQAGGGGRLGYFFSDVVGVELDAGYQSPSPQTGTNPVAAQLSFGSASLVLNAAAGPHHLLYLLGGYSRLDFEKQAPYRFTDNAVHGAIGDRIFLGERVALRIEARGVYAPTTNATFGSSWAGHIVGSIGLALFTGEGHLVDSDGDGVPDKYDTCPGTPLGATVDVHGCPKDSDGDGVYDGIDQCPNTPTGARVDAKGCPIDSDGDGVPDGIDQCPNTPAGAKVDAKGCPTDSDGDGVPDGIDQCPNTPAGAKVDAVGCPIDSDHDGVPDGIDKCPNTPAGAVVDSVGCPMDSDHDGVPDGIDKCPGTPPGTQVDAFGCPILFTPERRPVVLRGVTFETGKSSLRPESYALLDIVGQSLLDNPEIRIEVAGYTDNTGTATLNVRLSQARAEAVRAYLASRGVSPARMTSRGYGPDGPIATNTTAAGRAQNRRVELHQLP